MRSSRLGAPGTRSDSPLPRLSKVMTRAKDASACDLPPDFGHSG
jgi:hypothetical protein